VTAPSNAATPDTPANGPTGFARNVLPALLWTLALFFGGGGPPPPEGPGEVLGIPSDKLLHAIAFLVLTLLAARAVRYARPQRQGLAHVGLAVAVSAAIGVLLEVYQLALPDRSAELADAVADSIGAVLGGVTLVLFRSRRPA
jgi:VanZ family protein